MVLHSVETSCSLIHSSSNKAHFHAIWLSVPSKLVWESSLEDSEWILGMSSPYCIVFGHSSSWSSVLVLRHDFKLECWRRRRTLGFVYARWPRLDHRALIGRTPTTSQCRVTYPHTREPTLCSFCGFRLTPTYATIWPFHVPTILYPSTHYRARARSH